MATAPSITFLAAASGVYNILVNLNTGGAGTFNLYDGTKPANADTALSGNTLLATFTLGNPAFGGQPTSSTGAVSTLLGVPLSTTGLATSSATFFRAKNGAGTAVVDGTVGTSAADAIIDNASIVTGQTVLLNSWTFKVPIT